MAKIAIKSEKITPFWRHIPKHGAFFLPSLLYNCLKSHGGVRGICISLW